MNIRIGCSFTISKKLEALLESGEPLYIQVDAVHGNKGMGHMTASVKRTPRPEEIGNTSIMLDVISVDDAAPDYQQISPVGNFFTERADVSREPEGSPISKFAKTNPDSEQTGYTNKWDKPLNTREAHRSPPAAPATSGDTRAPSAPPVAPEPIPEEQGSIMSYEELMREIESLGNIDFDTGKSVMGDKRLDRAAAVMIEKQGRMAPRIKRPAFIRNIRGGCIEIADMEEKVADQEVFDLGRVPARRLRDSRDLKWCLDRGMFKFCPRSEYLDWLENRDEAGGSHDHGLQTGSIDEVADSMFRNIPDPMAGSPSARGTGRSSQAGGTVARGDEILDLDGDGYPDDPDEAQRRKLIETMDPGGIGKSTRTIPSGGSRDTPVQGGGPMIKSIRKV